MGCFNVAGTMSNLTIAHGDKVAFFILCPSNRHYKEVDASTPGTNLVSNAGACIVTKPYCPPIFGEYNDYGSVENIVESQTTRDLEKYFSAKIEDIINSLTRLQWDGNELKSTLPDDLKEQRMEEFGQLSGMFEHEDVVHTMVNYVARENTVYQSGYFTDEIMELIGFKYLCEEVNDQITYSPERYNKKWQKNSIVAYSDGNYMADTLFINDSPIKIPHVFHPRDIAKLVGISPWTNGMNQSCVSIEIEKHHKAKAEYEDSLKALADSDTKDDAAALRLRRALARLSRHSMDRFPVVVENEEIGSIEDLELLHHFNRAMYSTNNFYFPAMSGEQHGNNEIDKVLHDVRGNILFNKLNNRDYD